MLQKSIATLANTISEFEPVVMFIKDRYTEAALKMLGRQVEIWNVPTDDLWCRVCRPILVINDEKQLAVAYIQFNGWGNKQVHRNDVLVVARVAQCLCVSLLNSGLVGEGSGVELNDDDTELAHESCWINDNRKNQSCKVIEKHLLTALGADKMVSAPRLKGADITGYHIDGLARFCEAWTDGYPDAQGRSLELVTLLVS